MYQPAQVDFTKNPKTTPVLHVMFLAKHVMDLIITNVYHVQIKHICKLQQVLVIPYVSSTNTHLPLHHVNALAATSLVLLALALLTLIANPVLEITF